VDAKQAELRAESLIRRTELLRSKTSSGSFRSGVSPRLRDSSGLEKHEPSTDLLLIGYHQKKLHSSVRSFPRKVSQFESVRLVFEKSRSDLYKRLVQAFSDDCGCEDEE